MSRTAIVAFILTALLLGRAAIAAPSCGARIQAYATSQDYDDALKPLPPEATLFEIEGYSSAGGSWDGLVVKEREDHATKVVIEVRQKGAAPATHSFETEAWTLKPGYRVAKGFSVDKVFANGSEGTFVMKLSLNGRVVCENRPAEFFAGD